jgi:hypothetical protein
MNGMFKPKHRVKYLALLLLIRGVNAQHALPPSPDASGDELGKGLGAYNVTNSFETGYRFTTVGGDANLFRSVENYGDGIRLFGASVAAHSLDGHGPLFDTFSFNSSGLGNDPYGVANITLEKNEGYRYDMTWRQENYFNASQLNGESDTLQNTRRTIQDHDLAIPMTKWAKLLLGYTRNQETGPEFTAYETYIGGLARSVLPLDRSTRRDFNGYRLGGEFTFLGFRLSVSHRWEYYKDDSSIASLIPGQPYPLAYLQNQRFNAALEATYPQAATAYSRSQPMHTQNLGWFGNLSRSSQYWAMNARISYGAGKSNTIYYESETGASQATGIVPTGDGRFLTGSNSGFGKTVTALTNMPGNAVNPFTAGDLTFSIFPIKKLTITSSTSVDSNRYDGRGREFRHLTNGTADINRYWIYHLGTGKVSDALDLNYTVNKWLGLNTEYRYTSRFIDNDLTRTGTTNSRDFNTISDHLNEGTVGIRLKPLQRLSISADGSLGRDNAAETPTSPAHFHNIRARADYRVTRLKFGMSYRQIYNLNAPLSVASASTGQLIVGAPLDYYASHSRDYSAHASFEADRHLSFDVTYDKAHLDTLANLWAELVPAGSKTITAVSVRGYTSEYISNLHTVSFNVRSTLKRATLYAGYNISTDTGDGRSQQNLGLTNIASAYTATGTTFPLTYQFPQARLSIRLTPKLQWNGGWELYRYHQEFAYFGYQPYYRAHTGYTSLSLSF